MCVPLITTYAFAAWMTFPFRPVKKRHSHAGIERLMKKRDSQKEEGH